MSYVKRMLVVVAAGIGWAGLAHANEPEFLDFDVSNMYYGGELSYTPLSGRGWDDAVGAQAFGGWDFLRFRDLTVAGEAGVLTSVSCSLVHHAVRCYSIVCLYVHALAIFAFTDSLWVQGRAGTNFSDTGGGMIGGGIGLRVTPAVSVRFEAARYGDVTSLFRVDAVVTF